jgi:hypothetical protein
MSSKNFVLTSALFSATLAAIAEGTTIEKHAAQAVSFGVCTDAKVFVSAFETMSLANAELLSLKGTQQLTSKVKPSKSKPLLKAVKAVAKHNAEFPSTPVLLSVGIDGVFSVMLAPKPKKKRAAKGSGKVSEGSRKSSYDIALACCEADNYTIERSESKPYKYSIDGYVVQGHLSKALYALDREQTTAELTKYHYKQ